MKKIIYLNLFVFFGILNSFSQNDTIKTKLIIETKKEEEKSKKKWFDLINIRGYAQVRYNKLLETNPNLGCEQCDKSWGGTSSFFIRRGRLIFSGQVHDRIFIYIQPDFASSAGTTNNIFQIRDAYFDLSLDKDREYRFRIGQSKVPYGFENMQSSQNRLTLDRNDGLNSAVSNERDLGVFFYWATKEKRELFKKLVDDGYKGSGDYGLLGLGVYNGQTANQSERNNNQHVVARFTYPFEFKNGQVFEAGVQAYNGKYVVNTLTSGTGKAKLENNSPEFLDQRAAASLILYPQPFGFQAEYNVGRGPQYNTASNTIEESHLEGGYIMLNAKTSIKNQIVFPFVKYHYYNGGKKHELDARSYKVNDLEIGIEWQPFKNFELVADYTISRRIYEDAVLFDNKQSGSLLRLQAQFNF